MDPLTLITSAVAVGRTVAGFSEAKQQEQLLRQRQIENRLAEATKENQRASKLRKVLGAQIAQVGASGVGLDSGSFKAIQVESINEAAQDQKLEKLQADITDTNLQQQEKEVRNAAMFNAFNNIFEASTTLAGTVTEKKKLNIFGNPEEE